MHTHVKRGLPCIARVTYSSPGSPGRFHGEADDCYEAEPPEVEFALYTLRGKRSAWLEKQMSQRDYDRIFNQLLKEMH